MYWWEKDQEHNTNLLVHLFMHSLLSSYVCPEWRSNPQTAYGDDTPPNWATRPGLSQHISVTNELFSFWWKRDRKLLRGQRVGAPASALAGALDCPGVWPFSQVRWGAGAQASYHLHHSLLIQNPELCNFRCTFQCGFLTVANYS